MARAPSPIVVRSWSTARRVFSSASHTSTGMPASQLMMRSAGTHLHRGGDSLEEALTECRPIAALLAALEAPCLTTLPAMYTDLHPHVDTHVDPEQRVERFLDVSDPDTVSICLDTGHVAYAGGDNRALVAKHPGRNGYVHLKSIDPDVLAGVRAEGMSFADAVKNGAMVEPPRGEPDMPALVADLNALGSPLIAIVEHDMYPAPPGAPLPIATRACRYYTEQGLVGYRR